MSKIHNELLTLCFSLLLNMKTTSKITYNYFKGKYDRTKDKPRI